MTKKMIMAMMVFLAGLGTMALAGCATYGAGFSTMTGERAQTEGVPGVTQDFQGITVFAASEYGEFSVNSLSGKTSVTEEDWTSGDTVTTDADITGFSMNLYWKYPFYLLNDRLTLFPMAGLDLHIYDNFEYTDDSSNLFLRIGGGVEYTFSRYFFLKSTLTYSPILSRTNGVAFSIGAGFRTEEDEVRSRYKTGAEIKAAKKAAEQAAIKKAEEEKTAQLRQKAKTAMEAGDWNAAVEAYTQIITEIPHDAAAYFARSEAYLGAKDYDASVRDFNKGVELGTYLPSVNGHPVKWRQLYREYREAKGEEAPMEGRAIVIIPNKSRLSFVKAKTPGLEGAQGDGAEAMLKAGRQAVVFRYNGSLSNLTAMTIGDCTLTFDLKEGHVYTAVAGFDGRNFTIRIDDVTGKETGLNEKEEPAKITTLTTNMFHTSRFKKGMTIGELRRAGFPETWKTNNNELYATSIGSGDRLMTFSARFGNEGLLTYSLAFFIKYRNELVDLLSNVCVGPVILDSGNLSWVSPEGVIIMDELSDGATTIINITVIPLK